MIPLKPIPNVGRHQCPYCQIDLTVSGWVITGMRNLAEVFCARCKREFYEDLPSGQGFYTPILLDKLIIFLHKYLY